MGLAGNAMNRRRWIGGGLLVLLVLGVVLVAQLRRHGHAQVHPLAASERIDLCPFLARPPAPFGGAAHAPQRGQEHAATCEFTAPDGRVGLRATLSSTRQLSRARAIRTDTYFDILKRQVATGAGAATHDLQGPWKKAFAYRDAGRNLVVAEDHGVVLVFESRVLGASSLEAWAADSTAAVRESPREHHGLD
jgi:hypothetical protein